MSLPTILMMNDTGINDKFEINDNTDEMDKSTTASEFEKLYGVLLIGALILIFFSSGFFKVHQVVVTGNHIVTDEEVLFNARIQDSQTLFQTHPDRIRANLLKDPRISSARVRLQFPNQVSIRIRERIPIFLVSYRRNLLAVSEDGVVLSAGSQESTKLPVITGMNCTHLKIGAAIKTSQFETARVIALTVDDQVLEALSEIDLKNYQLFLDFPAIYRTVTVELGNARQLEAKLANLRAILAQTDLNNVEKIDLRTAESPTIISHNGGRMNLNTAAEGEASDQQ